jgi:hypothetical protein
MPLAQRFACLLTEMEIPTFRPDRLRSDTLPLVVCVMGSGIGEEEHTIVWISFNP